MPEIPADRPLPRQAFEALSGRFPDSVLSSDFDKGELSVTIPKGILLAVLGYLKDDLGFGSLNDLIVLDNLAAPEGKKRFSLLYQLYRFPGDIRIRLVLDLDESEGVDSIVPLYRSADWAEREAYDMFGIVFEGHPGLRRIYLEEDFEGHPLRKDFPLAGRSGGL